MQEKDQWVLCQPRTDSLDGWIFDGKLVINCEEQHWWVISNTGVGDKRTEITIDLERVTLMIGECIVAGDRSDDWKIMNGNRSVAHRFDKAVPGWQRSAIHTQALGRNLVSFTQFVSDESKSLNFDSLFLSYALYGLLSGAHNSGAHNTLALSYPYLFLGAQRIRANKRGAVGEI